jgi:hypothetical protein
MTVFDAVFCFFWMLSIFALAGLIMGIISFFERLINQITNFASQFLAACGGF